MRPYDSKELRSFVISLASRRAAVVGACLDVLPASAYAQLIREIGETPADISMEVRRLRALKSPWEIERIRRAAEQVEPIFAGMADLVEPGMPEIDLSARIESRLRVAGHSGLVRVRRAGQEFPILALASGPAASYPSNMDGPIGFEGPFPTACAGAGWRRIQAGETFMADIVTQDAGYHADNARTFAVGSASEATLAAHAFCREALAEVVQRVRPGAVPSAIYEEVRAWAEARGEPEGFMGFGENRVRFFGHGVGLELDELPVIAPRFDDPLAEGMVIAIEPKAFSPTHGPAGLENTYIVTSSGAESLCRAPDEIVVL
ncbi:MAG: Xaa-Pro peptidase family protein [Deltaproteobacteria bacterium]|nr:Xaa-Pro peptidase family protein [Deltaproteobacteria bacterium]